MEAAARYLHSRPRLPGTASLAPRRRPDISIVLTILHAEHVDQSDFLCSARASPCEVYVRVQSAVNSPRRMLTAFQFRPRQATC